MEYAVGILGLVLTWQNGFVILVGVAVGIVVGAIPGLTGTIAVAIALPFTFTMTPVTAILLLVAIYKASMYGGSIPAILFKAPGTPASACTVLDGYPLASKGEAKKALTIALLASVMADLFSTVALIFFAGLIASLALSFGPPEFFMLICFSLTIIAGVSGDSLYKGVISAVLGLLAATVGMDIIFGVERFSFGSPDLMAGLNFIPLIIGLFALPEIYVQLGRGADPAGAGVNGAGAPLSLAELKRCLKSIFRGSAIGVFLGAVPGIGGAPAAFLSYSEARRTSKRQCNFGKGELEGLAASEAGNNGVCGSTMIPLLALGIPGDVVTAVILGAFMMHDLRPGPMLFETNIETIHAIFIGILLSSIALLGVGLMVIRFATRVADIPRGFMFPFIFVACLFGAYAVNNSLFDVSVMLVAGVVGYGMVWFSVPAAPFLIGFVLGPLFESNLGRSLLMARGDYSFFLRSEISVAFFVLTIVSLILLVRQQRKVRSSQRARYAVGDG